MKDINMACKCYESPQSDCPADVHFQQFETDQWDEGEIEGLNDVLASVQQELNLTNEQCIRIREAIIQCYRPYDKMRQFFKDAHYARYPDQEPSEEACPFCGKYDDLYCLQGELLNGERRVFEAAMGGGELVRIQCGYCGAMGPVVALPESDRMLADPPWDAWNRRTLPIASPESEKCNE